MFLLGVSVDLSSFGIYSDVNSFNTSTRDDLWLLSQVHPDNSSMSLAGGIYADNNSSLSFAGGSLGPVTMDSPIPKQRKLGKTILSSGNNI